MNKQKPDKYDIEAEREGNAIQKKQAITPKNCRLKTLYVVDGQKFRTGEKHHHYIQSW